WSENGSINFKDAHAFKASMGGVLGSAKALMRSDSTKPVEFAGVTNQFFTTVVRPLQPTVTNVWARPSMVTLKPDAQPLTAVSA
ncbi:hypothetical protein ABK046_49405, partial [Streptomyces caeruleatus]